MKKIARNPPFNSLLSPRLLFNWLAGGEEGDTWSAGPPAMKRLPSGANEADVMSCRGRAGREGGREERRECVLRAGQGVRHPESLCHERARAHVLQLTRSCR